MLFKNIAHVGSFKHFVFVYLRICVFVYFWRILGLSWLWRAERKGGKYSRGDGDDDNDNDNDDDDNDDRNDNNDDDDDDEIEFPPVASTATHLIIH